MSFVEAESQGKKRASRRQRFLTKLESVVPWTCVLPAIEQACCPKGERGRPPSGLGRMPRICLVQQWYGLSDEVLEDVLYDSIAMGTFAGIDLAVGSMPDPTTLLKFRRLPVEHGLTRALFDETTIMLCQRVLLMKERTIVDAAIIEASSSTKNAGKSLGPEMHHARRVNEWHLA
jgi:IS5 family transposase